MADQSTWKQLWRRRLGRALSERHERTQRSWPACRIYRGWPNPAALDADLAAGLVNVTVFPGSGTRRNTTRYLRRMGRHHRRNRRLTVSSSATSVTFGGTAERPARRPSRATASAMSTARRPATRRTWSPPILRRWLAPTSSFSSSHATLTVAGAGDCSARVVADAAVAARIRRQEQGSASSAGARSRHARRHRRRDRPGPRAHRFIALADGTQRPADLRWHDRLRPVAGRRAVSPRPDLQRRIRHDHLTSSLQPAMLFGTGAQRRALSLPEYWRLSWTSIWSW